MEMPGLRLPAGALGRERGLVLPVLHKDSGVLVFYKPPGVLLDDHPWYAGVPSVMAELRKLSELKPERLSMEKIECVRALYNLPVEVGGACVLTTSSEATERLRNAYGSGQIRLRFEMLARASGVSEEVFVCNLPLAKDNSAKNRMFVSHKNGKASETAFRLLEKLEEFELWEADVAYLRDDQVILHAFESGIVIPGEQKYAKQEPLYLSEVRGRRRLKDEKFAHFYPLIDLKEVEMEGEKLISPRNESIEIILKTLNKRFS